jgi:hypothetical protein
MQEKGHNAPNCIFPNDEEPLLQEEHASPVECKILHLPDFPIDPNLTYKGWASLSCFGVGFEYTLGLVVAVGVGGFICYLGMTDIDDELLAYGF